MALSLITSPAAPSAALAASPRASRRIPVGLPQHVAMGLLLVWWAGPMTRGFGGRDPWMTAGALGLALLATAAVRPWRTVSPLILGLSATVAVANLVMCLATPAGWFGADSAATLVLGALVLPLVIGYAATVNRRLALAVAVCLAGAVQFAEAFLPWWGGADPSKAMVGTFYWWNPFAAYLLPGALLAVGLAVRGPRPWRLVGWLSAPLCLSGIALSGSRTTLLLAIAGTVAIAVVATGPGWRGAVTRWVAVAVLSAATLLAISGPPFFEHRAEPGAAASARAEDGESATHNGAMRVMLWERAVAVVRHHPVVGTGPHTLVGASDPYVRPGLANSNLAHSGYLQAFSDGGLVLGLPVLAGSLLAAAGMVRRILRALRRPADSWLAVSASLAGLALLAHSAVDFDWTYSSDLLLTVLVLGIALAPASPAPVRRAVPIAAAGSLALVALLMTGAVVRWDGTDQDINAVRGTPAARAAELRATGTGLARDDRWAGQILTLAAGAGGPLTPGGVAPDDIRWALKATQRQAGVDPRLAVARIRARAVLGDGPGALEQLSDLSRRLGKAGPDRLAINEAYVRAYLHLPPDEVTLRRLLAADPTGPEAGARLQALLSTEPAASELDRCLFVAVPADLRLPTTPDPGAPSGTTDCQAQRSGALR